MTRGSAYQPNGICWSVSISTRHGLGQYFLDSLFSDVDALALYAGVPPKPPPGLHRSLSKRFPFAIY